LHVTDAQRSPRRSVRHRLRLHEVVRHRLGDDADSAIPRARRLCGFAAELLNEETIAGVVGWGKTLGCIASRHHGHLPERAHSPRRRKGGAAHTVFRAGEVHGRSRRGPRRSAGWWLMPDSAKVTAISGRALVESSSPTHGQRHRGLHWLTGGEMLRSDPIRIFPRGSQRGYSRRPGARLSARGHLPSAARDDRPRRRG